MSFFSFQSIQKHFKMIPCPEKETLAYFIYMIKTHKSKLDQKPDSNWSSHIFIRIFGYKSVDFENNVFSL